MSQWLIFSALVLIAVLVAVVAYQQARKRREELSLLARSLGLRFDPYCGDVHDRYEGFSPFGQGYSRRSSNLLSGRIGQIDWEIFDYHYTTGSGKHRQTHQVGVVAANVPIVFPTMMMRAEGFFDRIASLAGFDDINFESEQFSRRYHVHCDDRKFAYDLIHPQMIEYLLSVEPRHWQMYGTRIVLARSGRYSPGEIAEVFRLIEGFVALIPDYVRQDRGLKADRERFI